MAVNRVNLCSAVSALAMGVTLACVGFAGSVAFAPAAVAAPIKSSPEFGKPMQEAKKAIESGDLTTAAAKLDQAAPHAKAPVEKLAIEQFRMSIAVKKKDTAAIIKAMEAQIATGALPASEVQKYRQQFPGLYDGQKNTAKAVEAAKAYIGQYGMDTQLASYLASKALAAKDYNGATDWINKAIEADKKSGKKPPQAWYEIALAAQYQKAGGASAKDLSAYYTALERIVVDYPSEKYWRELTKRAEREAHYNKNDMGLDEFRLMVAAGIPLKPEEGVEMAELALTRFLPAEAVSVLKPLVDSGKVGGASDKKGERTKRLLADATAKAATDITPAIESEASADATGKKLAQLAEVYMTHGQHDKAISSFQAAIGKIADAAPKDSAKLRLGIAQYKAGKKDDARKTWADVKADNGSAMLAHYWIIVSKK